MNNQIKESKLKIKKFYRRIFPHFQLSNKYYFVTSRLLGSIPEHEYKVLKKRYIEDEKQLSLLFTGKNFEVEKYILMKKYFGYYDDILNRSLSTVNYLSDDRVAKIVADSFDYLNEKEFDMISYCIMPNHIHFLVWIGQLKKPFYKTMQSLKRHTSRQANIILNKTGAFWEEESFDHIVRDKNELVRIIDYILYDPLRAGLVTDIKNWKWSYCWDLNLINGIEDFSESKIFI